MRTTKALSRDTPQEEGVFSLSSSEGMDDSLESLLDKATNPRNRYEDWEFIMGFCDKVNTELQGPQVALRIIVPKIRSEEEKVAMLGLAVLEACVKNCGQKFHQELGKFKFLNELIRMLSPKYLGETTCVVVKERIKELLYSWKVGLPHETKINDAYLMLKREGLIFDESVPPDRTLEPDHEKPKVSLIEDPKQSQMLQKLLSSKNPDDLRAANRLIREMVRRDEKRMQKLQKRMEDVELIQNNVKLLNELLTHMQNDSGEQERLLVEELYKSIDKMRPKIFRMASELKGNEEGMSDILQTNDSILRVMDLYTNKMASLPPLPSSKGAAGASSNSTENTASKASASDSAASGSQGRGSSEANTAPSQNGISSGATGGSDSDVLIDLADLNFDPVGTSDGARGDLTSSLGLSSLLDDISALDLGTPTSSINNNLQFPSLSGGMGGAPFPGSMGGAQPSSSSAFGGFQSTPAPLLSQQQQQQQQSQGASLFGTAAPLISTSSVGSSSNPAPSQPLLGSTSGSSLITIPPPPQQQATPALGVGVGPMGGPGLGSAFLGMGSQQQPMQQVAPPVAQSTPPSVRPPVVGGQPFPVPSPAAPDPLAALDNLTVALSTIKPGSLPPLNVMNKNNVAITFYFAENSPAPGVSIVVISIISTSPVPVSNFQFQAAVPKVMRVKLQPPTTTDLGAYNPILPPPSISQVMLLANPTKAKIRMKYRISYKQGGPTETVEMGEVSDFPASL